MRATAYSGVGSLDVNISIGTLLNVKEYLLDDNSDGVIDQNQTENNQTIIYPTVSEGNFTVSYTAEGRYKPRVTIRTEDNLLYNSGYYAMALDVKGDENQTDPRGAGGACGCG